MLVSSYVSSVKIGALTYMVLGPGFHHNGEGPTTSPKEYDFIYCISQ
jgi:hypothetical protein